MYNNKGFLKLIIFVVIISLLIYFIYTYFTFILMLIIINIIIEIQKYKIKNKLLKNKINMLNNKKPTKVFKIVNKNNGMNIINNMVEMNTDIKTKKNLVKIEKNICVICNIYCKKKCGQCKTAYYCCVEHQIQDWKHHKTICTC